MTEYTFPSDTAKRSNNTVLEDIAKGGASSSIALVTNSVALSSVSGVSGNSYIFACSATSWAGGSAKLQALGPDSTTWMDVGTALTANGTQGVVIGSNATIRVVITGSPTGLYANIS